MRYLIFIFFLMACPKKNDVKTYEKKEKERALQELLEEEDFDEIPEANEDIKEED